MAQEMTHHYQMAVKMDAGEWRGCWHGLKDRHPHRCSVVTSVHVVEVCLLCAWGNFCFNREHLSLEEVVNVFPKGEGRSSKLRGKKSHAGFPETKRSKAATKSWTPSASHSRELASAVSPAIVVLRRA